MNFGPGWPVRFFRVLDFQRGLSFWLTLGPVSYTHLDVYKRQEQFIIAEQLQQEMANRERWAEEISFRRLNLTGLVLTLIKQISSSMTDDEFRNRLLAISRKPNDS